jgi:hypothetical protein
MKKNMKYILFGIILLIMPLVEAKKEKQQLSEAKKSELRKKGLSCLAGSALCSFYAYSNSDKFNQAFEGWDSRLDLRISPSDGLTGSNIHIYPSEGARAVFSAACGIYLGIYGLLCITKPKLVA